MIFSKNQLKIIDVLTTISCKIRIIDKSSDARADLYNMFLLTGNFPVNNLGLLIKFQVSLTIRIEDPYSVSRFFAIHMTDHSSSHSECQPRILFENTFYENPIRFFTCIHIRFRVQTEDGLSVDKNFFWILYIGSKKILIMYDSDS